MYENSSVLTLGKTIGVTELLTEVSGIGLYQEVEPKAILVYAFDRLLKTLDIRSLVDSKSAARRETDLISVEELETLS